MANKVLPRIKLKPATLQFIIWTLVVLGIAYSLDNIFNFGIIARTGPVTIPFILSVSLLLETFIWQQIVKRKIRLKPFNMFVIVIAGIGLFVSVFTLFTIETPLIIILSPFMKWISGALGVLFAVESFRD